MITKWVKRCALGSAMALACSSPSVAIAASRVSANDFWVVWDIHQGMTLDEFNKFVAKEKITISHPLNDDTIGLEVDKKIYWLQFCDGKLTYASFITDNNSQFIKSLSQRLNDGKLRIHSVRANSNYSDTTNKDLNTLTISLRDPNKLLNYSVQYSLFDDNGQVTLEDVRYDDSIGCVGDKP